jgi:hypothetical protein
MSANTRPAIVTAVTVGTSSAQGVAGRTRNFLLVANDSASGGATVAMAFGSTAAVINGAGSITLVAGATIRFTQADGLVPNDALNFIASGAGTSVTVIE